ncbi:DUF6232 family protein [Leptothrix ochracea]|uniref:DUF6232 family protein n=1 Tax=Leptothrix ochracea TaxID=735331 RepID=UPI0034E2BB3F
MTPAPEQVFLSENGVRITNIRFIVDSQTFAMSGITSVKPAEQKPSRVGPASLIGLGIFLMATTEPKFGGFFVAIGAVWAALQKSTYHVALQTASGEAKALISKDPAWVQKVVFALNEAIIHRG